jgi:hypothetical protein
MENLRVLTRLSDIGQHPMLRHRSGFQPYQTLRLMCYRLLAVKAICSGRCRHI